MGLVQRYSGRCGGEYADSASLDGAAGGRGSQATHVSRGRGSPALVARRKTCGFHFAAGGTRRSGCTTSIPRLGNSPENRARSRQSRPKPTANSGHGTGISCLPRRCIRIVRMTPAIRLARKRTKIQGEGEHLHAPDVPPLEELHEREAHAHFRGAGGRRRSPRSDPRQS